MGDDKLIEEEIKALENKKLQVPKGFSGFFTKRRIQSEINQRKKYLNDKQMIKNIKMATEITQEKTKLAKARADLNGLIKNNLITMEQLQRGIIK